MDNIQKNIEFSRSNSSKPVLTIISAFRVLLFVPQIIVTIISSNDIITFSLFAVGIFINDSLFFYLLAYDSSRVKFRFDENGVKIAGCYSGFCEFKWESFLYTYNAFNYNHFVLILSPKLLDKKTIRKCARNPDKALMSEKNLLYQNVVVIPTTSTNSTLSKNFELIEDDLIDLLKQKTKFIDTVSLGMDNIPLP